LAKSCRYTTPQKNLQFCGRCEIIAQVGFSAVRRAMFIATLNFMLHYFEALLMFNINKKIYFSELN
jgi:hypothetical protein